VTVSDLKVLATTDKSTDGLLSHCRTDLDIAIVHVGVYDTPFLYCVGSGWQHNHVMEVYMRTEGSQKDFLKDDLSDALKGLFVGAVVWEAADKAEKAEKKELCPFLKRLAASASFVQARALYEFYDPKNPPDKLKGEKGETAHASHFGKWTEMEFTSDELKLFEKYIRGQKATGVFRTNSPINKRVFHLAYDRSDFSGGLGQDGSDHLKNQPLEFATNLHDITKKFIEKVEGRFRESAKAALEKAREGARQAATGCNIANPL
jgi:hypothetical protein